MFVFTFFSFSYPYWWEVRIKVYTLKTMLQSLDSSIRLHRGGDPSWYTGLLLPYIYNASTIPVIILFFVNNCNWFHFLGFGDNPPPIQHSQIKECILSGEEFWSAIDYKVPFQRQRILLDILLWQHYNKRKRKRLTLVTPNSYPILYIHIALAQDVSVFMLGLQSQQALCKCLRVHMIKTRCGERQYGENIKKQGKHSKKQKQKNAIKTIIKQDPQRLPSFR